jgi:sec-independent protein translocase protein TatB
VFDVGFTELVLIGLVALLVVGPERLPELVRTTGRWIGRAQRLAREMRTELERDVGAREIGQLKRDFDTNVLNQSVSPDSDATPKTQAQPPGKGPDQA